MSRSSTGPLLLTFAYASGGLIPRQIAAFLLVALTVLVSHAKADFIAPTGLAPGSQYQVLFVTEDGTNASSTDINVYNAFVRSEAAMSASLPSGVTWNAMVSTDAVSALSNAPTYANIPIYNTQGQLLFDQVPPDSTYAFEYPYFSTQDDNGFYNQFGGLAVANDGVWTGTGDVAGYALGDETPFYGLIALEPNLWLTYTVLGNTDVLPLYALSTPITVGTPEPSSLVLMALGATGLFLPVRRRREPTFRAPSPSGRNFPSRSSAQLALADPS